MTMRMIAPITCALAAGPAQAQQIEHPTVCGSGTAKMVYVKGLEGSAKSLW